MPKDLTQLVDEDMHARADGDGARVGAVFEFLVVGLVEGTIDVFPENVMSIHIIYPG